MDNQVFGKVDDYISSLLATDDDALQHVKVTMAAAGIEDISVSAVQGKLLQVLAKACNATRILELGTLGAYSTIWMARALPEGGKVLTLEYSEHNARVAQQNIDYAGLTHKIEVRTGRALDLLPAIIAANEGPFDLIFIDADKPPYPEYFKYALQLVRPGSIIVCDNVVRNAQVLDEHTTDERVQGVQRLNKFLSTCTQVTATIMQTVGAKEHDGMVIAVVNG